MFWHILCINWISITYFTSHIEFKSHHILLIKLAINLKNLSYDVIIIRTLLIIIVFIIKRGRQCKAERESDLHPISPKTPAYNTNL